MLEPTRAAERASIWPDTTTVVAMGWVFLTVYGALAASSSPLPVTATGWLGSAVTLVVTCSVVQRRRWGRIALIGIAAVTMLSGAWAAWDLTYGTGWVTRVVLRGVSFQVAAPATPGDGLSFSLALVVLGAVSLAWMLWPGARSEFERRKKHATRRTQVGIAAVVVAVWLLGAAGPMAHPVGHILARDAANGCAHCGSALSTAGHTGTRLVHGAR